MKFKRPSTRPLFKNPLAYRDGWKCEWSRGHRLDKIENSGYNVNVTFKYDENGIRNQKVVNGVQTNFITSGIKLLGKKTGENVLLWQVDGNDNTIGFNYNNIPYFYMKNLQGDIVGITDASGNIVAKYTYDSWGKLISIKDASDVDKTTDTTFIGYINPLRYRGYYYDSETGLYYLNARYYDPEVNRFISADETLDGGYNLFEYCFNCPLKFSDYSGKAPICIGPNMQKVNGVYTAYNCYGWAINRVTGKFATVNPPGFIRDSSVSKTIRDLADATVEGLAAAGARSVSVLGRLTDMELQNAISSLTPDQYLIAMRINLANAGDYHYMRLEADHHWTHKQGEGGMLFMLNGITPNDDEAWVSYDGDPFDGRSWYPRNAMTGAPVRSMRYNSEVWYVKVTM